MSPIYVPGKVVLAKGQPVPNDPSFAFNSLLLHGNGANGSASFTDSSPSPKTITRPAVANNNTQTSTDIADPYGNASAGVLKFDGTSDYLVTSVSNQFTFGATGDFTVEFWVYPNGAQVNNAAIVGNANNWDTDYENLWTVAMQSTGVISFYGSSGTVYLSSTATLSLNQWTFVCFRRTGTTIECYLNGVARGSRNTSTNLQNFILDRGLVLGIYLPDVAARTFNGYVSDLRITKGVARNPASPTTPFPDF
jgi:hypothetical protein